MGQQPSVIIPFMKRLIPSIGFFEDEITGFQGPLMGMKSAWTHVQSDYVLFVPCDVTFIPKKVFSRLHQGDATRSELWCSYCRNQ